MSAVLREARYFASIVAPSLEDRGPHDMELVGWNMGIYPPTHVRHVVWFARHLSPSKRGVILSRRGLAGSRRGLILSRQGLVVTNIGLEFQFSGPPSMGIWPRLVSPTSCAESTTIEGLSASDPLSVHCHNSTP